MSDLLFPVLPGLGWSVGKAPEFKTVVTEAVDGSESRIALWSLPRWHFKLTYEVLRDDASNELRTLAGFFLARQGKYDSFLFQDPSDCQAVNQAIGLGDGKTTLFQAVRGFGGFIEPVAALDMRQPVVVRVNGQTVPQGSAQGWTVQPGGKIAFAVAPPPGSTVSADFFFLFRVRFDMDLAEFEQFMWRLWDLKTCTLVSVK